MLAIKLMSLMGVCMWGHKVKREGKSRSHCPSVALTVILLPTGKYSLSRQQQLAAIC